MIAAAWQLFGSFCQWSYCHKLPLRCFENSLFLFDLDVRLSFNSTVTLFITSLSFGWHVLAFLSTFHCPLTSIYLKKTGTGAATGFMSACVRELCEFHGHIQHVSDTLKLTAKPPAKPWWLLLPRPKSISARSSNPGRMSRTGLEASLCGHGVP